MFTILQIDYYILSTEPTGSYTTCTDRLSLCTLCLQNHQQWQYTSIMHWQCARCVCRNSTRAAYRDQCLFQRNDNKITPHDCSIGFYSSLPSPSLQTYKLISLLIFSHATIHCATTWIQYDSQLFTAQFVILESCERLLRSNILRRWGSSISIRALNECTS